jgi:hypothetical protein
MIKPLTELLRDAYNGYYKNRGIAPKKFSVGIEYKDEWDNYALSNGVIYYISVTKDNKDLYMGIPIQWVKRRRIECLPRMYRKSFIKFSIIRTPVIASCFPKIKIEDVFKV